MKPTAEEAEAEYVVIIRTLRKTEKESNFPRHTIIVISLPENKFLRELLYSNEIEEEGAWKNKNCFENFHLNIVIGVLFSTFVV